jgi:hypothetical protein
VTTIPKFTDTIGYAAIRLIDADRPPSHDELARLFAGVGLSAGDPGPSEGKVKRMRAVIAHAQRHDRNAGARLVYRLIGVIRGAGGFRSDSPSFVGKDVFRNLQDAYRSSGYELADDGELRPLLLDNVPQAERHAVLGAYVRRIRAGASDAPLVSGSGKDLLEASAQTVMDMKRATYAGSDFPGVLYHAFEAVDLPTPEIAAMEQFRRTLSSDPGERVQQVLYLLGCEINKLRNAQGAGHGHAYPATITDLEARTATQAMALVSELLLARADE